MQYFQLRDFDKSLNSAFQQGGQGQNAAKKVKAVLGNLAAPNPFEKIVTLTNHGESRIPHCLKYDLGNGWRLVTRQHKDGCVFLYVDSHDRVDLWLDERRGTDFAVDNGRIVPVGGRNIPMLDTGRRPDHQPIINLLDSQLADQLLADIPWGIAKRIEPLDASTREHELRDVCACIADAAQAAVLHEVFRLLLAGNVDGAEVVAKRHLGLLESVDDLDEERLMQVQDGPEVRRIRIGSPEYEKWLADFEKRAAWHEWFLFMHPDQERIVREDYPGPAQLSGVSGSGKTCVAVRRALRLAAATGGRVLLVTLNRSLAGLLHQLVEAAETDSDIKARIEVTSFFELSQRLLHRFEPGSEKLYVDVTWKLSEHVDEVFREYYRRWLNCHDAQVLLPLHISMNARGVNGETYLREEFDWVRSALGPDERLSYPDIYRRGRRFGILSGHRRDVLKGLEGWEAKMAFVGVTDYLGLTTALSQHLGAIQPEYAHVVVDEAQDFGTTELRILRKLVAEGPNDIFLCGDVAQTILPKHRELADAKIGAPTRVRLHQNYRNSREILRAAYEVLIKEINEDIVDNEDLEILDPRFANFSSELPLALCADSLEEEIAYARAYADGRLDQGARTACIAFAGFSQRDVSGFATKCGVPALHGGYEPNTDRLVFSDLEQTKGYEFDVLIIVQCTSRVLPPADAPEEERHRAACKLYVAMTRAKRELILSFHGAASPWLTTVDDYLATDLWSEIEELRPEYLIGTPEVLAEMQDPSLGDVLDLTGSQFVYTGHAIGLSLEAQNKLVELVDGRGAIRGGSGQRIRWKNVGSLFGDLASNRLSDRTVGPVVAEELRGLRTRLNGSHFTTQAAHAAAV